MGSAPDIKPKPFVALKGGTTLEPKSVITKARKIETESASYKKKAITGYSDGMNTFACTDNGSCAPQIFAGKINVYQTISTHTSTEYVGQNPRDPSGWHTSTHTHVNMYVEKEGTTDLRRLSYKTLRDMIPSREPAFHYLTLYKKHHLVNNSIMAGGLVLFVAGAAVLGNSVMSSSGKGEGAGGAMLLASPVALITGAIMHSFNRLNLYRAVAKHNGLKVK
jgi:hypothetical protein